MKISHLFLLAALTLSPRLMAAQVDANDLAMILPAAGSLRIPAEEPYFSPSWLTQIDHVFRQSTVEDAFLAESHRKDWRLVSIRIAPCQPLLPFIHTKNQVLCEAEIRLIWQPIEQLRTGGLRTYYADDRAIHALYHVEPTPALSPEDASTYLSLKKQATDLSESETETYGTMHRRVMNALMTEVLSLRGTFDDSAYGIINERPEFQSPASARRFMIRLATFLQKRARPDLLKEATAFSLPAGRQPPLLDDWVFAAFNPMDGGKTLTSKNITLHSRHDGRILFDYGPFMNSTMRFDDMRLHDALPSLPQADTREIENAVILKPKAPSQQKNAIANRLATHVSHTSCASCHKLKEPPFDMHNLSYLEDRPLVPSPRVEQDVAHDLTWLRAKNGPAIR